MYPSAIKFHNQVPNFTRKTLGLPAYGEMKVKYDVNAVVF